MHNDMLVFDAVVHPHDFRATNMRNDDARHLKDAVHGALDWTVHRGGTHGIP